MSDRKYRQRGYQDEPRESRPAPGPRRPLEPRAPGRVLQDASGPKTPNLMPTHEVVKCARCGNRLTGAIAADDRCTRCGVDLHSCIQCEAFDTSSRWECSKTLPARVAPKDERNACALFAARTTVERQTGTPAERTPMAGSSASAPTTNSARAAFDALFK